MPPRAQLRIGTLSKPIAVHPHRPLPELLLILPGCSHDEESPLLDQNSPTNPGRFTRAYVARRTAEGKTSREIKRCLARYVARDLYAYSKTGRQLLERA